VSFHGAPRFLRGDNGPELVSKAILRWVTKEGIETAFIDTGKPWQNGSNESFNSRFRDECLNLEIFENLEDAKTKIGRWRRDYNRGPGGTWLLGRTGFSGRPRSRRYVTRSTSVGAFPPKARSWRSPRHPGVADGSRR
jgi:putative transposase